MQKLAQICIRRPVFATMLIVALVVLGLDGYRKLGIDLFPKIEFPTVTITTTLRGAAPEEVESELTKRIEEAVNTISGIDELRSISAEGVSLVFVSFLLEKDPDVAAQEVRDKVNSVLGQLPRDADQPIIEKIATDASPVINLVISSPRDLRETTKIVDDVIKKNIESISGVGQVRFVGDRRRQIQIWLDGDKLYSYGLNIDQVRAAIASQNVEIPGGRVDQDTRELSLRTLGRVTRPEDFGKVIVASRGRQPVRISDIATVEDGVEEPRSVSYLNGRPAVALEVRKQAGTNTVQVIANVKERVEQLKSLLPRDFEVTYARDQSTFIEASFKAVQEHLLLGGLFAAIIVLFFIRSWRSTLIAAVAIPTSIISTYALMHAMGFTLNQITMLALTLIVGIVIDDAIVVLENIFRFMEEKKLSPMEAAIQGTRDIGLAVMATTFSLVIIFLPVALMGGIVGRFMSSFGYTAAFAILVSLLVSFTLTPMLCSRFLRPNDSSGHGTRDTWLYRILAVPYRAMLVWSMRHRWAIVAISFVVMLSSAPLFMAIGKDFIPTDDQSAFEVSFRMPVGSSLKGSEQMVRQLEEELRQLPGIRAMITGIGNDNRRQVDRGSIYIELTPIEERKESQAEIMNMARERMSRFRDLTIGVQLPSIIQGAGPNVDLQYYLQGPDLEVLDKYASAVRERLRQTPGVVDVDSSYEPGKPEVRVRINRDKAADLGVNVASIATALRTLVAGDDQATTYREGDDRYDVQLRVKPEFRNSPAALQRLFVPSGVLGNVPVSNVAVLEEATGPTQIERFNRQRQILLSANFTKGQSLSNVLTVVDQTVKDLKLPPQYASGPVGRTREFGRASANYVIAFLLSILFMYMVLAAQFESFIDPVTILISLPLSVPFALLSLWLTNENFSIIYTSLGILILFGIVKKNAILQIDHIKSLRRDGMNRWDAIMHGCEDRLRPILMTTASLVAGMLPLALGGGAGSGSRRTVAVVVIGGQSLCLLLTLLVTPVTYSIFDDMAHSRVWARMGEFLALRRRTARKALSGVSNLFSAFLLLAVLAVPLSAQQPRRIGVSGVPRNLTLSDAIQLGLAKNVDIDIQRAVKDSVAEAVRAALGFSDPLLRFSVGYQDDITPAPNVLQAPDGKAKNNSLANTVELRWQLPKGGSNFSTSFSNTRLSSNNPFLGINPLLTPQWLASFSQPLLRNRETDRQRTEIWVRRKQVQVAEADFEARVIGIVTQVQEAYWTLAAARAESTVRKETLDLAQDQLERTKRFIESNSLAPVELAASEAELERRRDSYIFSFEVIAAAENRLKTLLASGPEDPLWQEEIIPTDDRSLEPPPVADIARASTEAVKRRPEVRALGLQIESNDLQRQLNENQTKPAVNLIASVGQTGLAGAINTAENPFSRLNQDSFQRLNVLSVMAGLPALPPANFGGVPGSLVGGWGTAWNNLFTGGYRSYQAGVQIEFNVRNRTAESAVAQSVIADRRLKLERTRLAQAIEADIRNSLQAVESARQRIDAADASVRAAREKAESEVRLFQSGESTNFLVLTRQNELAESRFRAVASRWALNQAVARLQQALGVSLEENKIVLQ